VVAIPAVQSSCSYTSSHANASTPVTQYPVRRSLCAAAQPHARLANARHRTVSSARKHTGGTCRRTCGGVPRRPSLLPAGHSRRPALSRPLLLCSAARRDASLLKLEPPCAQAAADLLAGVVTKPVLCCTVMLIRRHLSQAHRSKFVPRVPVSVMGGFRRRNARNSNFIPHGELEIVPKFKPPRTG